MSRFHRLLAGLAILTTCACTPSGSDEGAAGGDESSSGGGGEQHEKELAALRAKHGFSEEEDDQLWSAINDVVAAKPLDNPMMGGEGLKMYRDMQARGGDEKKAADEILKGFEEQEKQGLAAAREKYGAAGVDLLAKRSAELSQLQADLMKQMMGQMQEPPK